MGCVLIFFTVGVIYLIFHVISDLSNPKSDTYRILSTKGECPHCHGKLGTEVKYNNYYFKENEYYCGYCDKYISKAVWDKHNAGIKGRTQGRSSSPSHKTGNDHHQPAIESALGPIYMYGNGYTTTKMFTLERGLAQFLLTHDGASDFFVILHDGKGKEDYIIVEVSGVFDGSEVVNIGENGSFLLDVTADGDWTIKITQV